MSKRKTQEEFTREVYELVGKEYVLNGKYVNAHKYVEMRHFSDSLGTHDFTVRPTDFLSGKRCKCGIKRKVIPLENKTIAKRKHKKEDSPIVSKRKRGGQTRTHEEFLLIVKNLVNDEYTVMGEYLKSKVKIKIRHNSCNHIYEVAPNDFFKGRRCPKCAGNLKKTTDMFKKEVYSLVDYDYSVLGEYINDKSKILIEHIKCGNKYLTKPNTFLNGHRCPDCSRKKYVVVKGEHGTRERVVKRYRVGLPPLEKSLGYIFPELTIEWSDRNILSVHHIYSKSNKKAWWKCKTCSYEWETRVSTRTGKQKSGCPVCNESKGERRIREYLDDINIEFVPQKEFDNLIGTGGGNLSYDFYLPKQNILIEYQGKQHEQFVKMIHLEKENFLKQLEHDRRKREYAEIHNIKLLEIWYWDFDKVEKILDMEVLLKGI